MGCRWVVGGLKAGKRSVSLPHDAALASGEPWAEGGLIAGCGWVKGGKWVCVFPSGHDAALASPEWWDEEGA